ncbi:cysteine-rich receptor-like protein kinase 10 isoform X1 [Prosopis cineraria]|uniref:cysteine-rich receptor-like protein kinase 10 isoform X1 n=1 Tax=Prosopis cineraria TaxID=364024 RepID=UPI00240FB6DF|nr:cysteine-rich receptor-like protein kinase 10 isoform X1 [Prosopis cineraria]
MMGSTKPIIRVREFRIIFYIAVLIINFIRTSTSQAPIYVGDDCHDRAQQALTASYKANLNQLLAWLSTNAGTSEGYNHTAIGTATNAVYGLYDCRGDTAGYFCQFCVSAATRDVLQRCPNQSSAVIWFDFCILRYSNNNFFGNVTTSPSWIVVGAKTVSDLSFMRSLIQTATEDTKELGARGEFDLGGGRKRYALVQCSRDLNTEGCRQCLEAMVDKVPQSCEKLGWQVLAPSCLIKYDDFMFYQSTSSSSPNSSTDHRCISLSSVAVRCSRSSFATVRCSKSSSAAVCCSRLVFVTVCSFLCHVAPSVSVFVLPSPSTPSPASLFQICIAVPDLCGCCTLEEATP